MAQQPNSACVCQHTFVCCLVQVTHIVARGQWSDVQFKEAIELCMGGCQQLDGALRQCLQTALESKLGQQQQQQQQGGQT